MIEWLKEVSREDRDPQRFDAKVGRLFLRVIERDDEARPIYYAWGVSETEHPFDDELSDVCIARGVRGSATSAKSACKVAASRATERRR